MDMKLIPAALSPLQFSVLSRGEDYQFRSGLGIRINISWELIPYGGGGFHPFIHRIISAFFQITDYKQCIIFRILNY